MNEQHHTAVYNGKEVVIDYVSAKDEFKRACQRIIDNGANGFVITPKGQRYQVSQSSRMAKLIKDEDGELLKSLTENYGPGSLKPS